MLCKLSITMSDILGCIYNEHSFHQSSQQLSKLIENLHSKLVAWKNSLSEHLSFDTAEKGYKIPPPHVLSLQYVEPHFTTCLDVYIYIYLLLLYFIKP